MFWVRVCTCNYALQIWHQIADYDTLGIMFSLTGDSELNPCLKTPLRNKLMQLAKS